MSGTSVIRKNRVATDLLRILDNPNLLQQKINIENVFRRRSVCNYKQQLINSLQQGQNVYDSINNNLRTITSNTGVLPNAVVVYFNPKTLLHGEYSQAFDANAMETQQGSRIRVYGPPVPIVGNYKTKQSIITIENETNGNTISYHQNGQEGRKEYMLHCRIKAKFITPPSNSRVTVKLFMRDPSFYCLGTHILEEPFNRFFELSFLRNFVLTGNISTNFFLHVSSGTIGLYKDTSGSSSNTDTTNCIEIYEVGDMQTLTP